MRFDRSTLRAVGLHPDPVTMEKYLCAFNEEFLARLVDSGGAGFLEDEMDEEEEQVRTQ